MIIGDVFFTRDIFQPQGCSQGTFGGGARGDVCLNGLGLKPVSGHRDTGAVNRAKYIQRPEYPCSHPCPSDPADPADFPRLESMYSPSPVKRIV